MKKLFVLCSLVVAVTCQPVNDVSSLTGFLAVSFYTLNLHLSLNVFLSFIISYFVNIEPAICRKVLKLNILITTVLHL